MSHRLCVIILTNSRPGWLKVGRKEDYKTNQQKNKSDLEDDKCPHLYNPSDNPKLKLSSLCLLEWEFVES